MKPRATMPGCCGVLLILAAQIGAVWNLASPQNHWVRGAVFLGFALGCALFATTFKAPEVK